MLQLIKKIFSSATKQSDKKSKKEDGNWAAKQFKEMAKLRGKLILM